MGECVEFVVRFESEDVDVLSEKYDSPDKDSSSGTEEAVAERWRPFLTVVSIDGGELQSLLVCLGRSTRAGDVLALLVLERPPLWPPIAGRNEITKISDCDWLRYGRVYKTTVENGMI